MKYIKNDSVSERFKIWYAIFLYEICNRGLELTVSIIIKTLFMLVYTSAKNFKANPFIAVSIIGVLMHSTFIAWLQDLLKHLLGTK